MTELLLKHAAKVGCLDDGGFTPLHYAAKGGHKDALLVLLSHSAQVDQETRHFWTALHFASHHGHSHIVKILCEHKANIEVPDDRGQTPLHFACAGGYKSIVDILIQLGADVEKTDNNNQSALELLPVKIPKGESPDTLKESHILKTLSEDFRALLENDTAKDVTFICEDGLGKTERVKAHRVVLSARIPRILDGDKSEINIRMSGSTLHLLLEWAYAGTIRKKEILLDSILELYFYAEEYDMKSLAEYAEHVIKSNVDDGSVKDVLEMVMECNISSIIKYCASYIFRHLKRVLAAIKGKGQQFTQEQLAELIKHADVIEGGAIEDLEEEEEVLSRPLKSTSRKSVKEEAPPTIKTTPPPAKKERSSTKKSQKETTTPTSKKSQKESTPTTTPTSKQAPKPRAAKGRANSAITSAASSSTTTPSSTTNTTTTTTSSRSRSASFNDKMDKKTLEVCTKLLNEIYNNNKADIFRVPVSSSIPNYYETIKEPMDLGTLKKNLSNGVYKLLKDFVHDVRLVFNNARQFNIDQSYIYQDADSLSKLFEERYLAIKKELQIPSSYDAPTPFKLNPILSPNAPSHSPKPSKSGSKKNPGSISTTTKRGSTTVNVTSNSSTSKRGSSAGADKRSSTSSRSAKKETLTDEDSSDFSNLDEVMVHTEEEETTGSKKRGRESTSSATSRKKPKYSQEDMSAPLTREELEEFTQELQEAIDSRDDLVADIVKILELSTEGGNELDLDIENMAPDKIRKLQNWLRENP
eukprot:TRINITY_DN7421_c0_g1_i1.p1 TRINITY_DN7421_c0_g1~~TRINITY_DN7421_c0_g1_i1.p1  ORF type:complete len:810 (-),score=155.87 TRINITY_DN7421_c0_g1_i1:236-2500(-)